jgi:hypothetical protein
MLKRVALAPIFTVAALVLAATMFCRPASAAPSVTIHNDLPRRDMNDHILDAHDGSLKYFRGRFYLYGTHYGDSNGLGKTNYFVCYSSGDLTHWKYEGKLLTDEPLRTYYRPHVEYNAHDRQYVLWYNADNEYGVAVSANPAGPFHIVNSNVRLKYSGRGVGDFDLFVDPSGTAYVAYTAIGQGPFESLSVENPTHHVISVERLTTNYLSSTLQNSGIVAGNVEAPAMFWRAGTYYLLFDNTCAFCKSGSGARVYTSRSPLGPYGYRSNINMSDSQQNDGRSWTKPGTGRPDTAIDAQQLGVATIPTSSGTLYMWMGDRWGSTPDGVKGHDFQVWLPLTFQGTEVLPLDYREEWTFDIRTRTPVRRVQAGQTKEP